MPVAIANAIGGFQADPEYAFDEMPMPYDININAQNAGTKEVVYNVIPARNNTSLTAEEETALQRRFLLMSLLSSCEKRKAVMQPTRSGR
jgi:hypothetical protein